MKSAKIMDDKLKMKSPSMKKPEIMDEKPDRLRKNPESVTVWNFRGLCLIYGRWRRSCLSGFR